MSKETNTIKGASLSVLIIDDEESLQRALCLNLELHNYSCTAVQTAENALKLLENQNFDVILCDYKLPDKDGLDFIKECQSKDIKSVIILMTGFGSNDLAIKALKAGAYDYIAKPFDFDEVILTLKKLEEREKLKAENDALRSEIEEKFNFNNIVAKSQVMLDVFGTVKRLADFNTTVLVRGESGTGKELIAKAIHHNSPRKGKPFIAINCGAIPENLMESELFGHKAGAFTDARKDKKGLFEEANGGTIFLDEIGEMSVHLRVKLLRVLQEQQIQKVGDEKQTPIDVRVIAATLRNLEKDVEDGLFRDDLYYRLNVVSIVIPPLRDRPEDIPILVEHFIEKHSKKMNVTNKSISPETIRCLMKYRWKGNVRELENSIERGLIMSDSDEISVSSLPSVVQKAKDLEDTEENSPISNEDSLSIKILTKRLEKKLIRKALEQTKGNRTHAAKLLEISHRALLYKLKTYNLEKVGK